jgi:uncharacterized cupin superfamily protein
VLGEGDTALFAIGPEGAHAIRNAASGPARVMVVSTMVEPDIGEFPDSGKFGLFAGVAPGGPDEQATLEVFVPRDSVEYFEGERRPEAGPG